MKVILPEALADSANTAVVAMINVLPWIVVPKLAFFAVVFAYALVALDTVLTGRLNMRAMHAHHGSGQSSIDRKDCVLVLKVILFHSNHLAPVNKPHQSPKKGGVGTSHWKR